MNIQPVSLNQKHQQNFGMQVRWATPHHINRQEADRLTISGQQMMRKFLGMLQPNQRIELSTTLKKIEELEQSGAIPSTMLEIQSSNTNLQLANSPLKTYLQLYLLSTPQGNYLQSIANIVPHRLDGSYSLFTDETASTYAEAIGNNIISNLRRLIPQAPSVEVSADELAGKFGITA